MQWKRAFRASCVVVLLILSPIAFAKPKLRIFQASCDQVWGAVKKATAPPHYNFAQLDDAQKKGIVSTGNTLTGKRYLDITLTAPTPDTCSVALGGQFSGLTHDDKGDLYTRIDEALKSAAAPTSQPATPPPSPQK